MRSLAVICLLLTCAACIQLGGKPQTQRYHLLAALGEAGQQQSGGTLLLAQLDFPEYLDRPQLVARQPTGQLRILPADRWAEPLQKNLARVIKENLQRRLPRLNIDNYPWQAAPPGGVLLKISVYQFDGVLGSQTNVDIRWSLSDPLNQKTLSRNHFQAELPIGDESEDLVLGLSRATDQLCTAIGRKLLQLKQQPGEKP